MNHVTLLFTDKRGHFHEEEMTAINMTELELKADRVANVLATNWGFPVSWRKRNGAKPTEKMLKVKIEDEADDEFETYLNGMGFFYQKVKYAKDFYLWRVDVPLNHDIRPLRKLPFVLSVENMDLISAD